MTYSVVSALCLLILNPALLATVMASGEDMPQSGAPPPELERLSSTVGVWETTTLYRPSPDASPLERRSVETIQWSPNHQFLITDQLGATPAGTTNRMLITTWSSAARKYKVVEIGPIGGIVEMTMLIEGKIQKILGYRPFEDRLIRVELTVESVSTSESKFRWECTNEAKTWICGEGISRKRQAN